jgi:hypothetical protein
MLMPAMRAITSLPALLTVCPAPAGGDHDRLAKTSNFMPDRVINQYAGTTTRRGAGSPLALLVTGILADDPYHAVSPYHLAITADFLH